MGACDTWNVEINISVYENEMFSLPAEFHFSVAISTRFSICWAFSSGIGTIAKLAFHNYLFWFIDGSLVTRFMELVNSVEVGCWLGLEDLACMFSSYLSGMSSTNGSRKSEIRFCQKSLTKSIVICTTNDYIFNEGVSKIFEFTLSA